MKKVVILVALLATWTLPLLAGEFLMNDSDEPSTALRVTFSEPVVITAFGEILTEVTPNGEATEFTFSGGVVKPFGWHWLSWEPETVALLRNEWIPGTQQEEHPPLGAQQRVFFDDFSTDSNVNGLWTIYRPGRRDANPYEGSWDERSGAFRLTTLEGDSAVAAFADFQLSSPRWHASFRIRIGGGTGADGIVFMFYKKAAEYYPPGHGGFLGFQPWHDLVGIPGYGIEFDTYDNPRGDTEDIGDPVPVDHIALVSTSVGNHLAYTTAIQFADYQWHNVAVEYEFGHVTVEVDGRVALVHQIREPDYLYSGIGFGAGTGGKNDNQLVDDFLLEIRQ